LAQCTDARNCSIGDREGILTLGNYFPFQVAKLTYFSAPTTWRLSFLKALETKVAYFVFCCTVKIELCYSRAISILLNIDGWSRKLVQQWVLLTYRDGLFWHVAYFLHDYLGSDDGSFPKRQDKRNIESDIAHERN
jgi:hypothetical protein